MWVQGGNFGLDKCQCTVQLTLFADGVPSITPFAIFKETGKAYLIQRMIDMLVSNFKRKFGVMSSA